MVRMRTVRKSRFARDAWGIPSRQHPPSGPPGRTRLARSVCHHDCDKLYKLPNGVRDGIHELPPPLFPIVETNERERERSENGEDGLDAVRMLRRDAGSDVAGKGAGRVGENGVAGRVQRRASVAARWAIRLCCGLGVLLLICLAEFLALKLLAG